MFVGGVAYLVRHDEIATVHGIVDGACSSVVSLHGGMALGFSIERVTVQVLIAY